MVTRRQSRSFACHGIAKQELGNEKKRQSRSFACHGIAKQELGNEKTRKREAQLI